MSTSKNTLLILLLIFGLATLLAPVPAQAWLQTYEVSSSNSYGFLSGLWHGIIAPLAVFAHLFDTNIILYASTNNGFWYNLGFLIGISTAVGGGACKASRRCE